MGDSIEELVGRNHILLDDSYHDDYLTKLNSSYPFDDILGKYREAISRGEDLVYIIFLNTLGSAEYEDYLIDLAVTSAQAGRWQGICRKESAGVNWAVRKSFAYLATLEGNTYLLPSEKYVQHCREKIKQFLKQSL